MMSLEDLFNRVSERIESGESLLSCKDLVSEYDGDDWKRFCEFCTQNYKRNLIMRDDRIEMLVLCWGENQQSGIHNHPEGGCLVKVLSGALEELCYDTEGVKTDSRTAKTGDISFQIGDEGRHNVVNGKERSVTLHIYSPPGVKPEFF